MTFHSISFVIQLLQTPFYETSNNIISQQRCLGSACIYKPGPYTERGQQGQLPPPPEKIKLAIFILL